MGKNWIKDSKNVYLWNPQPQDGETVTFGNNVYQRVGSQITLNGTKIYDEVGEDNDLLKLDEYTAFDYVNIGEDGTNGKITVTDKTENVFYLPKI